MANCDRKKRCDLSNNMKEEISNKRLRFIFPSLLVIVSFLLTGCSIFFRKAEISERTEIECQRDSDCSTGGCSGEICGPEEKMKKLTTICIYKPGYECLKLTKCRCLQNKCQWQKSRRFKNCMKKYNKNINSFDYFENK